MRKKRALSRITNKVVPFRPVKLELCGHCAGVWDTEDGNCFEGLEVTVGAQMMQLQGGKEGR